MKRKDLLKRMNAEARRQGVAWVLVREGGNHSVYRVGNTTIPVPRHREIGERMAQEILRQAEPELGKGWWR